MAEVGGFEGEEFSMTYWLLDGIKFTGIGWFQDKETRPSNKLTKSKNIEDIVSLK